MPKVNLGASYGYRDPATGLRKYYGPGQGIEVPQGLVNSLGLTVIPEAAPAAENAAPPPSDLPDDFPGRKYLVAAGYTTLAQVRQLSIDDLIAIKGIGTRLAEQILERLNKNA